MKQYDKITKLHQDINEAIDGVLDAFNYRRRHNNTTELVDFQVVAMGFNFVVVAIITYEDYAPDTSQAPPNKPRYIGQILDHSDS